MEPDTGAGGTPIGGPYQGSAPGADLRAALITRANDACRVGEDGHYAVARDRCLALLPDFERQFGPEHPKTLTVRANHAHWTGMAGDAAAARDLLAGLLPIRERVLGSEHPGTVAARRGHDSWARRAGPLCRRGNRSRAVARLPGSADGFAQLLMLGLRPRCWRKGRGAGKAGRVVFLIRDAVPGDMAVLRDVYRRSSLSNDGDRPNLLAHPDALEFTGAPGGDRRMRVAVADGRIAGFATSIIGGDAVELEDLFVDPDWMRQGAGRALVEDAVAITWNEGARRIEVTANRHALAFYQTVGFVLDGEVRTRLGSGSRMHRDVTP